MEFPWSYYGETIEALMMGPSCGSVCRFLATDHNLVMWSNLPVSAGQDKQSWREFPELVVHINNIMMRTWKFSKK